MDTTWDPEAALVQLAKEQAAIKEVSGSGEGEELLDIFALGEAKLVKGLPLAVETLSHIMTYSPNERLRLEAAKYMIDRNLGKTGSDSLRGKGDEIDPLQKLLGESVVSTGLSALEAAKRAADAAQQIVDNAPAADLAAIATPATDVLIDLTGVPSTETPCEQGSEAAGAVGGAE
jgi:hypothetical protein